MSVTYHADCACQKISACCHGVNTRHTSWPSIILYATTRATAQRSISKQPHVTTPTVLTSPDGKHHASRVRAGHGCIAVNCSQCSQETSACSSPADVEVAAAVGVLPVLVVVIHVGQGHAVPPEDGEECHHAQEGLQGRNKSKPNTMSLTCITALDVAPGTLRV